MSTTIPGGDADATPKVQGAMPWLPAHDVFGPPPSSRTIFLLHGILGNRNNWRTFARKLVDVLPGWTVVTLDHRHHGDSKGAPSPDTVDACAEDLAALAAHLGVRPRVTIGHSFGGKVVLRHAALHPDGLDQVWVLDTPPGPGTRGGEDHEVVRVLGALRDIPMPLSRRDAVVTELRARGLSDGISLWMTTNLGPVDGGFTFRFDLDACERLIRDYFVVDTWPVLLRERSTPRIDVVRAERSDRWDDETVARFAAIPADVPTQLHTLANAGHWLHADNPAGLLAMLVAGISP